jgi:alkylation response protein AidB-like acyl-CoA dehydrogenase
MAPIVTQPAGEPIAPTRRFCLVRRHGALVLDERGEEAQRVGDEGKIDSVVSSYSKAYGADAALRVATDAVQIFGGYGYTKDYPRGENR